MGARSGRAIALTTALLMLAIPAMAQSPTVGGMEPSAFVEKWGEIQYCREAYKHPVNKDRVYEFDTQQCDAAAGWIEAQVEGLPEQARQQLVNASSQRARVIKANTRDVGWVLGACREACQALAAKAEPGDQ